MHNKIFVGLLVLLVLVVGGTYGYTYLKDKPPPFLIKLLTATKPPPPLPEGDSAPLTVPEGFVATIYARDIPGARAMTRDNEGTMLVTLTSAGKVIALPDTNGDGKSDETSTVLEGLKQPHGLLVTCDGEACTLYVAETGELKAYAYDAKTHSATYQKTLATFPTGSGHFTRTLLMAPDGKHLYISIGSSCNVCVESDARRATIQSLALDTGELTTFASGLRNSVFMALDPITGALWATDNGRDVIGDDIPPDEVNIIREGKNYGWPFCYGQAVHDTDFDGQGDPGRCAVTTPAHIDLPAHSAALGLAFVPEEGWPEDMRNDLLVAFHGSWNRSEPTGYKVVRVDLSPDTDRTAGAMSDFVTGFLPQGGEEGDALGRPVGLMAEPGGVVYLSDDRAGAIYRIARTGAP